MDPSDCTEQIKEHVRVKQEALLEKIKAKRANSLAATSPAPTKQVEIQITNCAEIPPECPLDSKRSPTNLSAKKVQLPPSSADYETTPPSPSVVEIDLP